MDASAKNICGLQEECGHAQLETHTTIVHCVSSYAARKPNETAYMFLDDGQTESSSLSFAELEQRSLAVAAYLLQKNLSYKPVALSFQTSANFICAFLGCLYAGAVAVPLYPPRRGAEPEQFLHMLEVSDAECLLSDLSLGNIPDIKCPLVMLDWSNDISALAKTNCGLLAKLPEADDLAFLQFTSGSTGQPKGVMVSHSNIMNNQAVIKQGFGHSESTLVVGWLPFYHDMGLVGNLLQPLFLGRPCVLMPALSFVQKPLRWLQAISKYKATTSGGPNFAYELCVNAITDDQLANAEPLDLSTWSLAFTGAEPINADTLFAFSKRFARFGFNASAFYPCYGMSETTLMITGVDKSVDKPMLFACKENLAQGKFVAKSEGDANITAIVNCGRPYQGNQVYIVDAKTKEHLPDGFIGEIWAAGPSVAQGYWKNTKATQQTFAASTTDLNGMSMLRTGDLGFIYQGNLYVTGRLKTIVIVNGRNYYPHEIEASMRGLDEAFRAQCAVFQMPVGRRNLLVAVQEIYPHKLKQVDADVLVRRIRREVVAKHGVTLDKVILTTSRIPTTTSGKIKRAACREALADGRLNTIVQGLKV